MPTGSIATTRQETRAAVLLLHYDKSTCVIAAPPVLLL